MEKANYQDFIKTLAPNVDVVIWTLISKGTNQLIVELPRSSNGRNPAFNSILYTETTFEVKRFTSAYPSVWHRQLSRQIYSIAEGASEDKITATFHHENIEIIDFANEPILSVKLVKNPFDMDNSLPYLEIYVAHIQEEAKWYRPVNGEMAFGQHQINLFTNPVSPPGQE